jgi:hypothetical protein
MGFLGAAGLAARSIKKIKSRLQDTSKPGHTHSGGGDSGTVEPIGGEIRDVSRPDSSFMGKGQVEQFSDLTNGDIDRGGRAIPADNLDPVGIKTAMNPSMATPDTPPDVDGEGTMNALYS